MTYIVTDITKLQVDAIVNAANDKLRRGSSFGAVISSTSANNNIANQSCNGHFYLISFISGGGVCGAIYKAAGPQLEIETKKLASCPEGHAKITRGFNLSAKRTLRIFS